MIEATPKVPYDEEKFAGIKSCSISFTDFQHGDMVTPLPCDIRHCFYHENLINWFNNKVECPICRTAFTRDMMLEHASNLDKKLEEHAD